MGPNVRDGISSRWFLDPESHSIYQFESGGLMGMINELTKVMDVGPKAPPEALHS